MLKCDKHPDSITEEFVCVGCAKEERLEVESLRERVTDLEEREGDIIRKIREKFPSTVGDGRLSPLCDEYSCQSRLEEFLLELEAALKT